ncbi:MAG TPA: hypothetical protein VFR86_27505 [Burkholderiaceae bacterium]|nr:hypothetical protein [Burkholderiaceae bacterium]
MPKVRLLKPQELLADDAPRFDEFHPLLLADGDSWFALGSVPAHNLLEQLDFGAHGAVINLASPGETVSEREKTLRSGAAFRRIDMWAPAFARFVEAAAAYPLDAVVLSAGGNDLVDAFPHLLKRDFDFQAVDPTKPEGALDAQALRRFDDFVRASLTGIVNFVRNQGGPNHSVPVFCHTYDVPTPNDAPATILGSRIGQAWLYPRLVERQVPPALWAPLIESLVRHLATVLRSVKLPDFHVISTQDTLTRAHRNMHGESGDWENEIHPNSNGYRKLARRLSQAIAHELGVQEGNLRLDRADAFAT